MLKGDETMMNEENSLKIVNVTKTYGYGLLGLRRFKALDNITFTIDLNEPRIFVLAGETGSGKTTLLKLILRMEKPTSGEIYYKGQNLVNLPRRMMKWYRKEIQAIVQNPYEAFSPLRKVDSYLYDTARNILGLRNKAKIEEVIENTLNFVGLSLDRIKGKYPYEFSGGELQRMAIARALIPSPNLLLADEPVSMLDASLRVNILNLLKETRDRLRSSIVYVTHDLATAYYIGNEIGILYRGTLVELGSVEKIFNEPLHPYTKLLFESLLEPDPSIRTRIPKIRLSAMEIKEFLIPGCRFSNRCPYVQERCWRELPPQIAISGRYLRCWYYIS